MYGEVLKCLLLKLFLIESFWVWENKRTLGTISCIYENSHLKIIRPVELERFIFNLSTFARLYVQRLLFSRLWRHVCSCVMTFRRNPLPLFFGGRERRKRRREGERRIWLPNWWCHFPEDSNLCSYCCENITNPTFGKCVITLWFLCALPFVTWKIANFSEYEKYSIVFLACSVLNLPGMFDWKQVNVLSIMLHT